MGFAQSFTACGDQTMGHPFGTEHPYSPEFLLIKILIFKYTHALQKCV